MLPSFKLSRRFVAAAALALTTAITLPAPAAENQAAEAPAPARRTVDYDAVLNSEKFKYVEKYLLDTTVRSDVTSETLRKAAKETIDKYVEVLPAGKPADTETLELIAIKGMTRSLTPHDDFMTPQEAQAFMESLSGQFVGIGVLMTVKEHHDHQHFKIAKPLPNSPAERAGIKAGDIILEVKEADGKTTTLTGMEFQEGISHIGGEDGSKAELKIQRGADIINISVTRGHVQQDLVTYRMLEGGVAHIHVASFSPNITADVRKAVATAKADAQLDPVIAANGGLKGVILDLSFDGGGSLDEAVRMVDDFLDKKGVVVSQQSRLPEYTDRHSATLGDIIDGLPMAVITNGLSASASEIVAGALQDHKRAIIVGQDTFGKGTVQRTFPLTDGSVIKSTVSVFKRPSGHSNQWVGVKVDTWVDMQNEEYTTEMAKVPTEKSLPNSLRNEKGFEAEKDKTKFVCSPVRSGITVADAGTDKGVFKQEDDFPSPIEIGALNPLIDCARAAVLKLANPDYTPKFTQTVPKAPALTN